MFEDYKTKLSLKVDWADLDLFGHVNNVAFFRYIQAARVNYCDRIGLGSLNETEFSFIVASTACDFKKPLKYPGDLIVYTRVERVGKTSINLLHLITLNNNLIAEGRDFLVVFDYKKGRKQEIGKELLQLISVTEQQDITGGRRV